MVWAGEGDLLGLSVALNRKLLSVQDANEATVSIEVNSFASVPLSTV